MPGRTEILWRATITLATGLGAAGCVYSGGGADAIDHQGPPLGVTVLRIPFEKFVIPPPPPGGFSATYQKQMLERQKLARLEAQREAQAKAAAEKAGLARPE